MGRILVLDYCNYQDYQLGGHLSFAKNLLSAFENDIILVGITTDRRDPVGRWFKKEINGITYDYFALARYNTLKTKHFIPDRLACYILYKYFKRNLLRMPVQNVFVQRPEIIPAIKSFKYKNICYYFPGIENPLTIGKYWYSKYFSKSFDKLFFSNLESVNLILAAGDIKAIKEMVNRSNGVISASSVKTFPTRIITDIFKPLDKKKARKTLNISNDATIVLTTGRLAWIKGWQLLIDCYTKFQKSFSNSYFYLVGEGEDRLKIQDYLKQKRISDKVVLTGLKTPEQVALLLNACDLYVMGSYKEGWSTSLSEAIACGTPAVVTDFSSADSIIVEGKSGYVIKERNEDLFVDGMIKAIKLPRPVCNENVVVFSADSLKDDLLKLWKLF